jgi:hypothetical protein
MRGASRFSIDNLNTFVAVSCRLHAIAKHETPHNLRWKKAILSMCYSLQKAHSLDTGCFPNLSTFVVGQGRTICEKGMLVVWTISTACGQFQVDF